VEQTFTNHCLWDWEALRAYCFATGVTTKILWISQEAFLVFTWNTHFYDMPNGISKIHAVIQDSGGQQRTLILAHRGIEVSTGEAGVFNNIATEDSVIDD
jgi:hypothetical protein